MSVADAIAVCLARGNDVTVQRIGGISALQSDAAALARSPFLDVLARLAGSATDAEAPCLDAILLRGFSESRNPTSFREAVGEVLADKALFSRLAGKLPRLLEVRIEAERATGDALLAAYALEGLFCFASAGWISKHRVLGPLTETQSNHQDHYVEHAAKLAGAAYGVWHEEELLQTLQDLRENDEAVGEASFELGLAQLAIGFEASAAEQCLDAWGAAERYFEEARIADEDRSDAAALSAVVQLVRQFHAGADRAVIEPLLSDLERAVHDRTSLLESKLLPGWLVARADQELAWVRLLRRLKSLASDLKRPSWLKAASVMEDVLHVYEASLSLGRPAAGLQAVVRPVIEAAFVRERGLLAHLEDLLSDDFFIGDERAAAVTLQARVATLADEGVTETLVRSDEYPLLNGLLNASAEDLGATPELTQRIENALRNYRTARDQHANPTVQRIFATLQEALAQCPDYTDAVREEFEELAMQVILFCKDRQDAGKSELGPRGAYLRSPDATEFDLQSDLREWLSGNFRSGQILTEVEGVATGRADIYVCLGAFRFLIELKRSHKRVTSVSTGEFMGQAVAYQATNVKLGMLGVLEIIDRTAEPADALDDCVWHEVWQPLPDAVGRHLTVFKVPGLLPRPSSLSKPTQKPRRSGGEKRT